MSQKKQQAARKAQEAVTAFVIAQPLGPLSTFPCPVALAPIANRPAIDYMIENLIYNGIQKIVILASPQEEPEIRNHIHKAWSHVGAANTASSPRASTMNSPIPSDKTHQNDEPALTRTATDIDAIELHTCDLENGFFNVMRYVKDNNLIRDGSYFIMTPIDAISNVSNIQSLVRKAIERHLNHKLIMTAVVRQDDYSLRAVYDSVMMQELGRLESTAEVEYMQTPGTVLRSTQYAELPPLDEESFQDESSFAPRCTFVFDPTNGMIQSFKEWKHLSDEELKVMASRSHNQKEPDAPYAHIPSVPIKKHTGRVCVRTDLMLTGMIICSSDVIGCGFDAYQVGIADVVNTFIARQIEWNVDIAIDVADSNSVVCPLTSLQAFLAANQRVSARYLYPMTRESNFGDVTVKYSVSRRAPLVCVPQEGCPELRGSIEGSCVFGRHTVLDETSFVCNSAVGDDAKIGKNVQIVNSVLGKNVTVKDGAIIVNSFVTDSAVVSLKAEIRNAFYSAKATNITRAIGLMANEDGKLSQITSKKIISTYEMLTSDNVSGEEEEIEEDWKEILLESYLNNKDSGLLADALRDFRLGCHKTNIELVQAMFEMLVVHLERVAKEDEDSEDDTPNWETVKAELKAKLILWDEAKAIWDFISLGDVNDAKVILEGISIGMARCPYIRSFAGKILSVLYCLLDEDMFEKRNFCIVPSAAIIQFDREQTLQEGNFDDDEEDEEEEGDYDEDDEALHIYKGWKFFAAYADKVRIAEEDDDEDEDEDEEGDE